MNKLYALGPGEYRTYLWDAPHPALFEGGVAFAGRIYVEAVRSVLGRRQPQWLFLTHAHWDHCGAAAYLKEAFPDMKIAASPRAVQILKRPNALKLIAQLNQEAGEEVRLSPDFAGLPLTDRPFRSFAVDVEIDDGQVLELGKGFAVEALATPGHTRDHLSYYLPHQKILMVGETAGILRQTGELSCGFVSDYEAYLSSLRRLASLPVEMLCQGHLLAVVGRAEVKAFFDRSIDETLRFRDTIYRLLDEEAGSIDGVVRRMKSRYYDSLPMPKQPEAPYLINATAQVTHLAAKKL
ncbi:MAG TPA: hypothetical protein DER60_13855 [Syntrophomonas sp.]|jgi:glyoxylase-like metal-dependent hydrolase (beta-lactamase superfamily II)|nr:hypothetical protein [Syntrophomonas sp.]